MRFAARQVVVGAAKERGKPVKEAPDVRKGPGGVKKKQEPAEIHFLHGRGFVNKGLGRRAFCLRVPPDNFADFRFHMRIVARVIL